MSTKRTLATLLTAAMIVTPTTAAIAKTAKKTDKDPGFSRIQGIDRVDTAIKISQDLYPPASKPKKNKPLPPPKTQVDRAVVVSAESWADAAIATPLAKNSPILVQFNHEKGVDPRVLDEIKRTVKKGGNVTIVGTDKEINKNIEKGIAKAGFVVERIGGATDAQTSGQVAGKVVEENKPTGFVGVLNDWTGGWFESAQTIYAVPDNKTDWETLIVAGNIAARNNGMVVIGGPETKRVAAQYKKPVVKLGDWKDTWPADVTPARTFNGPAATLALDADPNMNGVAFARAQDGMGAPYFADALVGGLHAARHAKGLVLTPPTRTDGLEEKVRKHTANSKNDLVYGGPEAISSSVAKRLAKPDEK